MVEAPSSVDVPVGKPVGILGGSPIACGVFGLMCVVWITGADGPQPDTGGYSRGELRK